MMNDKTDISVVIVSYKCLPVLRLALLSVYDASEGLDVDTYVVDNKSDDGTLEYLSENFTWVNTIDAKENIGFSRANNIALDRCRGEVILILNPDTIIPKNFLKEIVLHFKENPSSGAIGVNMTNGCGQYLPESKRGYPDVKTSFFKLSGLWHIAPRSSFFNSYYVGHLDKDGVGISPILSGACMAFSRGLMSKAGVFDPMFFMYGEDIDLSWRMHIESSGNIYRGDLRMIHFKGMSTPSNMKYIYHFYDAMLLFASKHERCKHHFIVNSLVALGIWFGLVFAAVKCVVVRNLHKLRNNRSISKLCIVGFDGDVVDFGKKVGINTVKSDMTSLVNCNNSGNVVIFDMDNVDIERMIEFMQVYNRKYSFGFYSARAKICLTFSSKGYNILWDGQNGNNSSKN